MSVKFKSKDNARILLLLVLENTPAVLASITAAYILHSPIMGFLLFAPISSICLYLLHHMISNLKYFAPILKTKNRRAHIHQLLKTQSSTLYFKNLHHSARKTTTDILTLFIRKKHITSGNGLYGTIDDFRQLLITASAFRIFYTALMFNKNVEIFMISTAIAGVIFSQRKKPAITTALADFITLPQRCAVIFDAMLRASLAVFFSKTFLYKWITHSKYSYIHSDRFIYLSSYFWSFSLCCILTFAHNDAIALSGLAFLFSPLYLMHYKYLKIKK